MATQARVLAAGGRFYLDTVDRKPPLLAEVYAGLYRVAGEHTIVLAHLLAAAAHAATACAVAMLAARWHGRRIGLAAGTLYLLASACLAPPDALAAGFETFMLPWTVAAVLAAQARRPLLAGLALAVATLTKQTAAATLAPVLWLLWTGGERGPARRGRDLGLLAAGFALPILAVAVGYGPGRFAFWTLAGDGGYLDPAGAWGQASARGLGNLALLAAADLALVLLAARAVRRGGVRGRRVAPLLVWLAAALVAVCAGFHFFGHYYLQTLPPLALLAAEGLVGLPRRRARLAAGYAGALAAAFVVLGALWPATEATHARQVARAVDAASRPGQPILVWGMNPQVYWDADRPPATRFLTAGFLTGFAGGRPASRVGERYAVPGSWAAFQADLTARPPAVIVDDSAGAAYRPERVPSLARYLAGRYRVAAVVGGAVVYTRQP